MKSIDLNRIAYSHRFNEASLLMSKANRLSGMASAGEEPVETRALLAALAYYDMALLLLKPYDSNYSTVVNWKCNALVALKQYSDAVEWYREIVRISDETDGKAERNATAALALDMISKYADLTNEPIEESAGDNKSFDDPPYCMHAEEFCALLAERKFKKAYGYLAPQFQQTISLGKLKEGWLRMVGKARADELDIVLEQHSLERPSRKADEIGWCYYSVSGKNFTEAASMVVARTPYHGYWITELEFGRP